MSKIVAFSRHINNKIQNNRNIRELKHRFKTRDRFRFIKNKEGDRYRVSKRLKYQTKQVGNAFLRRLFARPMNLVDLMIRIGLYKKTLVLKLLFILFPFVILLITNGFVIAVIIATIDIFCCALIFSMTDVERKEALVNGKFDYGKYKSIKAQKETIAILLMMFISMALIIIGNSILEQLLQAMSGLAME